MTKVLVVENDPAVRDVLAFSLTRAGHEVLLAESGEQALMLLDDADVILLDLKLPKQSGEDFLRGVRGAGNYIPVVVTSGVYPKAEVEKRLAGLDIVDFVPKPFSIKEILGMVEKGARVSKSIGEIRHSTDRVQGFIARQTSMPRTWGARA